MNPSEINGNFRIYNRTPHPVTVLGMHDVPLCTYAVTGEARATRTVVQDAVIPIPAEDGNGEESYLVPLVRVVFGQVTGLPDPEPGVYHIVSRITAEAAAAQGRTTRDLLIPDDVLRGPDGQAIGCRGFSRL